MMEANIMAQNIAKNRGLNLRKIAKIAFGLSGVVMALSTSLIANGANAKTTLGSADDFNTPYGMSYRGEATTPYDASTRDLNSNRTIVNGIIVTGDSLSQSDGTSSLLGYAIGNQLNVTTTGSYNTVVVDSTQINNGNQTVVINNGNSTSTTSNNSSTTANTVLNGGLSF